MLTLSLVRRRQAVAAFPNLIANGTFDVDATGWSGFDATVAAVGGELEVTWTNNTQYTYYDAVATDIGADYQMDFDCYSAQAVGFKAVIYETAFLGAINSQATEINFPASKTGQTHAFTATTATTVIAVFMRLTSGGTAYFDNVELRRTS